MPPMLGRDAMLMNDSRSHLRIQHSVPSFSIAARDAP
jgi:hypothetical protein